MVTELNKTVHWINGTTKDPIKMSCGHDRKSGELMTNDSMNVNCPDCVKIIKRLF